MALARKPPGHQITHRFVNLLTLCMLGTFRWSLPTDFFFKFNFSELSSGLASSGVSSSFGPVQARQNVGPGLDPNCLQMLSTDGTGR